MRHSRLVVAIIALFSLGVAQGCAVRRHPRPEVLPTGIDVAIESGPVALAVTFREVDGSGLREGCRATRVGGYSVGREGDVIHLVWVASVTPVVAGDTACRIGPTADVLLGTTAHVVPHNNLSRGQVRIILLVGLAAMVMLAITGIRGTRGVS